MTPGERSKGVHATPSPAGPNPFPRGGRPEARPELVPEASPHALAVGEAVAAAGASWARRRMADVRAEGRSVTGGWPGTRSEAHRIVAEQVAASGARPSHEEIEHLITRAYSRARATWLASAAGDDDPTESGKK